MSNQDLIDRVNSTAREIEDGEMDSEDIHEGAMEFKGEISFSTGTVSEVTAVMETGGPQIEIDLYSGVVRGFWGSDSHSSPIFNEDADDSLSDLAERIIGYSEVF